MTGLAYPKPVRAPRQRKPIPRRSSHRGKRTPKHLVELRAAEKLADRMWSFLVLADRLYCQRCCGRPATDPHHLISRRFKALRWCLPNGAAMCRWCHDLVTSSSAANAELAGSLLGPLAFEGLWARTGVIEAANAADAVDRLRAEIQARGLESRWVALQEGR